MFRNARSANDGYHRDSTLAAATSPFGGDLNRSTQHLLILPDEEVCAWMHGPGSRRSRRQKFESCRPNRPVRLRCVLGTASLWPRRLEKPVLVLLDHRTKRVTPLRLARSVDFLMFVDDSPHHVVLIEHSDQALYIGQQPGSELFATVVVDAEGYGQLDEVGFP